MRQHETKEDAVMLKDKNEELQNAELDLDALECVTGGTG